MSAAEPHHGITFGPFVSPTLGKSLGFNVAPARRSETTEGSVYDKTTPTEAEPIIGQRRTMPTPGVVITSAARRIIELSKGGEKLESLIVTGNNEPTGHPELIEIIENLRELRNKWFGKASLCLVSNSLDLEAPHLRHMLGMFDKPVVRFEWGTAKAFASATGRPSSDLKGIVEALTGLDKIIVQACFLGGKSTSSSDSEINNWIRKLAEVKPREVHIGTSDTKAKLPTGAKPLTPAKLEKIAAAVKDKTDIPVKVVNAEALAV